MHHLECYPFRSMARQRNFIRFCTCTTVVFVMLLGCGGDGGSMAEDTDTGTSSGGTDGSEDSLDRFFSLDEIHTLEIDVDTQGVAALLAQPKVYVQGSVTVDELRYDGIGVRLKGTARGRLSRSTATIRRSRATAMAMAIRASPPSSWISTGSPRDKITSA